MAEHLKLPIVVTANGWLATVEHGSADDLSQSVQLLVETRPGERRSVPEYGLPDPVFGGLDVTDVTDLIREWEDRADLALAEQIARGLLDQATVFADASEQRQYDYTSEE